MLGMQSHPTTEFNPNPFRWDETMAFEVKQHTTPSHLRFYVLIPHSSLPPPIAHIPASPPYVSLSFLEQTLEAT